jgi:hypothetical protein
MTILVPDQIRQYLHNACTFMALLVNMRAPYQASSKHAPLQPSKVISQVISGYRLQRPEACPQVRLPSCAQSPQSQCSSIRIHTLLLYLKYSVQRDRYWGMVRYDVSRINHCLWQSCYQVMLSCWSGNPATRPDFDTLSRVAGQLFDTAARTRTPRAFDKAAQKELDDRCGHRPPRVE